MRLFIGSFMELKAYAKIKEDFSGCITGKWVEPENLHCTLLFLGDQPDEKIIMENLKSIKNIVASVSLQGLFMLADRILAVHLEPREELKKLYEEITQDLAFLKLKPEKFFLPHVTLCRIKKIKKPSCNGKLKEYEKTVFVKQAVFKPMLIQSRLTPQGPVYKLLTCPD
ncbi:MAG: RNA 2',3'-cyclic phosphodiesterase [Candidatus Margulisbacteria bacterium]|nr:RNA 2',3'-cyclic phosphodiesterase [Candidatus Margulisiibacteriota bacterium]